jgi:sec-independent protein translocase protein TatC
MPIWDHLEELRERVLVAMLAAGVAIGGCFAFSKELVLFLEAPVADAGVRFLQLSPGEFFFTTFKVRGSNSSSGSGSSSGGGDGLWSICWLCI